MKKVLLPAALVIFSVVVMGAASALAAVTNGSFETGPALGGGGFTTLNAVNTDIAGWTVFTGSIDYIGSYWQASDGVRSVDLNGSGPASIFTKVPTEPGATYRLIFDLAGNPDGGPTVKTLSAGIGGQPIDFSFDTTGATKQEMRWTSKSLTFIATSSNTTVMFTSTTSGPFGPALDNVQVVQIAQPPLGHELPQGTGGAVGAVVAAAAQQGRENRAAVASPVAASAPATATGVRPPSTGDGGLLGH